MRSLEVIEYGIAARPKGGEAQSGDTFLVQGEESGRVVVGVIDGLGHGPAAAHAADAAVAVLRTRPQHSVRGLLTDCHAALSGTRGAVMAIAVLDAREATMTWTGVGNIEGRLVRFQEHGPWQRYLLNQPGIVGHRLPLRPRSATLALSTDDLILFATDGIGDGFDQEATREPPQIIADRILYRYGKSTDDALVLVGRWIGRHGDG